MNKINILDCTLRDGGYVNDWDFGYNSIKNIINLLSKSNIDFIEIGFLTKRKYDKNKTLFNSFEAAQNLLNNSIDFNKILLMIKFGDYDSDNLLKATNSKIKNIRLIFKKEQKNDALIFSRKLKEKGFNIFINPTFISQYNECEYIDLIEKINEINPMVFSIVDSVGVMNKKDVISALKIADNNLNKDCAICFHLHNNLQQSFLNTQSLLEIETKRNLIIDSSVFGMGRGAGNLCSELLAQYINENYFGKYNLSSIFQIIDEYINPIFQKNPWGYSIPYYLSAINNCHPNYSKYFIKKQIHSAQLIDKLLKSIPNENKIKYSESLIEEIYLNNK